MALEWLGSLKGSAGEANKRLKNDARERKEAGQKKESIILSPRDVLTGEWDASKILFTMLGVKKGGKPRPLSNEDLKAFKKNINATQNNFKKGITAKQVINLSLSIDRERATEQITRVVPVSVNNGKLRLITNASKDSDVTRHHVIVEFLNYEAEAASGSKDARKSALRLRKGALKFDCDCGRHRYWFRYITTIGGFNAGRPETGFPKIRNPNLSGVGCKHILRVMAEIDNGRGAIVPFLTRLMDKAKNSDNAKAAVRASQKEVEKIAKNQARRKAGNKIEAAHEKALKNLKGDLKKAPKPSKNKKASVLKDVSDDELIAELISRRMSKEKAAGISAEISKMM